MYKIDAAAYFNALTILQQAISLVQHMPGTAQMSIMHDSNLTSTIQNLERVESVIQPLALPVTKLTIRDAKRDIRQAKNLKFIECGQLLLSASQTLGRELESANIYALDLRRSEFYEPPEALFGTQVADKFPSIGNEISSAGQCYACGLPTAFAFHALRAMEAGLRATSKCLGIPDPTTGAGRNWGNIQKNIKAAIDSKWPKSSDRLTGDGKDFEAIYGALVGMTNPYRNETMHLSSNYPDAEAIHIFELVKGLMQKIASRMDENGEPNAP